jgi:hypothetical protein
MTKTRDQLLAVCLLDDSDLPLDRLALLFAVEHQNLPLIAVEQNLDEINRLADALSADDHSISEEHLVQFLFHQEGFKGNAQNISAQRTVISIASSNAGEAFRLPSRWSIYRLQSALVYPPRA